MEAWIPAGRHLRYREHPSRRHGPRPDRYWSLKYKLQSRTVTEALGWGSQGFTQAKAQEILAILRRNWRTGAGPRTWRELRAAGLAEEMAVAADESVRRRAGLTLAEFWEREVWPDWQKRRAPAYAGQSAARYRRWLQPLHNHVLAAITPADLENLVLPPMLATALSSRTVEAVLYLFSGIWSKARQLGLTSSESPAAKLRWPLRDSRRERFLSLAEASRLLAALWERCPDSHDLALLALFCGLRAGECSALTWTDINFDYGLISIRDPKNRRNRQAYMTDEVRTMLSRRLAKRGASPLIFPGPQSGGIRRCLSQRHFARAVQALGLNEGITDRRQKLVFHSLRHSFASWLAIKGQPLYVISRLLGHSDIKMTERYAHLSPEARQAAVMKLEGALDSIADSRTDSGKTQKVR